MFADHSEFPVEFAGLKTTGIAFERFEPHRLGELGADFN